MSSKTKKDEISQASALKAMEAYYYGTLEYVEVIDISLTRAKALAGVLASACGDRPGVENCNLQQDDVYQIALAIRQEIEAVKGFISEYMKG